MFVTPSTNSVAIKGIKAAPKLGVAADIVLDKRGQKLDLSFKIGKSFITIGLFQNFGDRRGQLRNRIADRLPIKLERTIKQAAVDQCGQPFAFRADIPPFAIIDGKQTNQVMFDIAKRAPRKRAFRTACPAHLRLFRRAVGQAFAWK